MKRFILFILLLVMGISFVSCTLPGIDKATGSDPEGNENEEMSKDVLEDDTGESGTSEESSNVPKSEETVSNGSDGNTTTSITLYYQDGMGYLIPVTRQIPKQEGIARAAVNGLIDNSQNREELMYYGLYPVIPKGTEVRGIDIDDGIAEIDFNENILNYESAKAERNIICSLVYTLTGFKTITGVKVLVNGINPDSLKFSTDVSGILDRGNILINTGKINLEEGVGKSDVYYIRQGIDQRSYYVPVSYEHDIVANEDKPAEIMDLYGREPGNNDLQSLIPKGTELTESSIEGDVLALNFNHSIKNYGGTASEDAIIRQIMYSMKQIKGINKLRIAIEGERTHLPEGTDISRDLILPAYINGIEEN